MRKPIEFQPSKNHTSALLTPRKPNAYEDLVLTDMYRKYRHRFEPGKTKIRLLPAMALESNWLLAIPTHQHVNGRHTDPRAIKAGAQSAYPTAYSHMQQNYPTRLFSRANMTGIRLLPMPVSVCWAIVEDANGIKARLILSSFYDGKRGGASGLGNTIYSQVLRAGENCGMPGHPLNPSDGVSLIVERIGASDTKFASYRVSHSDDRSPLQPLLEKVSDVEYNALCPLKETIRFLEPEEEWRLLSKVVGDEMAAEIRTAQESGNPHEECVAVSHVEEVAVAEEVAVVEETAMVEDDYRDFPANW